MIREGGRAEEAEATVRAIRRLATSTLPTDTSDVGARLREAVPRAVMVRCGVSNRPVFTSDADARWRTYAVNLLADAIAADGVLGGRLPSWLHSTASDAPLVATLEAVLRRKRQPCAAKLEQIEAMRDALSGQLGHAVGRALSGTPLDEIDVDAIFKIEKRDKGYLPRDQAWYRPLDWPKSPR